MADLLLALAQFQAKLEAQAQERKDDYNIIRNDLTDIRIGMKYPTTRRYTDEEI